MRITGVDLGVGLLMLFGGCAGPCAAEQMPPSEERTRAPSGGDSAAHPVVARLKVSDSDEARQELRHEIFDERDGSRLYWALPAEHAAKALRLVVAPDKPDSVHELNEWLSGLSLHEQGKVLYHLSLLAVNREEGGVFRSLVDQGRPGLDSAPPYMSPEWHVLLERVTGFVLLGAKGDPKKDHRLVWLGICDADPGCDVPDEFAGEDVGGNDTSVQ